MPNSQRLSRIRKGSPLLMLLVLSLSATCLAQSVKVEHREKLENYKGKNGVLSMKTLLLGGDFRVTTIIPFKGNLAEYHHLEITRPISLVGDAPLLLKRQGDRLGLAVWQDMPSSHNLSSEEAKKNFTNEWREVLETLREDRRTSYRPIRGAWLE